MFFAKCQSICLAALITSNHVPLLFFTKIAFAPLSSGLFLTSAAYTGTNYLNPYLRRSLYWRMNHFLVLNIVVP